MPARVMHRAAAALLACAVSAALLAGCSGATVSRQHRAVSYTVPGPVPALAVHAHVGDVQVTGGSGTRIAVTEQLAYRNTAPVTTHRSAAGTLTLDSHCPALDGCRVSYRITVPRATAVQVGDSAGTVRVSSVSGPVTVHASAGTIGLAGLSGPLDITGGAGQILGQGLSPGHAALRLAAGRIAVTFATAPASVSASDAAGSITLRLPGHLAYAVSAGVTVGSTTVSVPRSVSSPHVVTATVTTGSITIEPAA